jgi:predicted nucleic acid-binding protein
MRTALDTNILSLFWSGGHWQPRLPPAYQRRAPRGRSVFVELSAIPTGDAQRVGKLLGEMNITIDFDLGEDVWRFAASSFAAYAIRRRRSGGGSPKRLLPDFVIASHALLKADRLMTRDTNLYALDFPNLRLV